MGDFSRDTFNRLKRYVSIRLQQGVPILDSDWNELQDIRKFELEAFLKWFVGDGVPAGNSGFAIDSVEADNDFSIADGNCLVGGWDVVNDYAEEHGDEAFSYTSQRLLRNSELVGWGLAELPELDTPTNDRTDTVYLDVWEREVGSAEDDDIVNPDIGIETCVRIKRDWVVRVAKGATEKQLPSPPPDHVFYPLAQLNRKAGEAAIDDITDLRRTGLTISTNNDLRQIVTDAYGADYSLEGDGQPKLKVSLRASINAFLAGELLGTPPRRLSPDDKVNSGDPLCAFSAANSDIWVFWQTARTNSIATDIWYKRWESGKKWTKDAPLRTDSSLCDKSPVAFEDSAGEVWVFWLSKLLHDDFYNVYSDRYRGEGAVQPTWQGTEPLTSEASGVTQHVAIEDSVGNTWLFWISNRFDADSNLNINHILYRRFDGKERVWKDEKVHYAGGEDLFVFEDSAGILWLVWQDISDYSNIACQRYDGNNWTELELISDDQERDQDPFVLEDTQGRVWIFWRKKDGVGGFNIWYDRYDRLKDSWDGPDQLTTSAQIDDSFSANHSVHGIIWIFWSSNGVIYRQRHTEGSGWGVAERISSYSESQSAPLAILDQKEDVWIFWKVAVGLSQHELWYRKLISQI